MSIESKDVKIGQVFKTLSPEHGSWCVVSSKKMSADRTEAYVTFINEDGWADTVTGKFDLEIIKLFDNWQDMFPAQASEKKEFLQALSDLQNSITKVVKNTDNPYYKSKYADLNALFEQVKPLITEKGFVLIQVVRGSQLHTELAHLKTGESISGDMDLLTAKPDMQQLGSAITYARRYSLLALLNIETADDDGNTASGKTKTWDELETYAEFADAIKACISSKQVNALWYKWKDKFPEGTEEYEKLRQLSSDMKLKLENPDMNVEVR